MLKSMTGFGNSRSEARDMQIHVEIKSLNSKYFDLNLRIPKEFNEKEMEIRTILQKALVRGKVNFQLQVDFLNPEKVKKEINQELFRAYFNEIDELKNQLKLKDEPVLRTILELPDVMLPPTESFDEEDWKEVKKCINEALTQINAFREKEGEHLKSELQNYLANIEDGRSTIKGSEGNRVEAIRERLREKIDEIELKSEKDENRFEQEIVYYLEKLDVTEELVRLEGHLKHFEHTLGEDNPGKKLNFISQEMGREINTIGSKANDSEMQRAVVKMKDELEKIKEQVLNIL